MISLNYLKRCRGSGPHEVIKLLINTGETKCRRKRDFVERINRHLNQFICPEFSLVPKYCPSFKPLRKFFL